MRKIYTLLLACFIVASMFSQNKKVVFIGTVVDSGVKDGQVIDAIKAQGGYDVEVITATVADASILTQCNAADVVIIGRSIASSDVGSAMAVWDQITKPVINMNMWGMRNLADKAFWVNNAGCDNINASLIAATDVLKANLLVNDPVFEGATGEADWWVGYYSAFKPDTDNNDQGNGTLLAQTADARPLFIRWSAGVEFYPGAGHSPAGERSFIGCGQDNVTTDVRYFHFSEFGTRVFFNELARMAGVINSVNTPTIEKAIYGVNGGIRLSSLSNASIYSVTGTLVAKNINSDFFACQQGIYFVSRGDKITKVIVTE